MSIKEYTTTIKAFDEYQKEEIAEKWLLLESSSDCSVFLSWQWIGNWLDVVTDKLFVIEAVCGDKVVGLGFFVETKRKVFGCFPIKQWWLHRTGIQQQDQMWIEYNDFLLDKSCAEAVREQMIEAVSSFDSSVKEVIIGLASANTIANFTLAFKRLSFLATTIINTRGYLAKLSCSESGSLHQALSKNTRSQISRSKKLLQRQGEYHFEVISDTKKILSLFPRIANIHIERWQNTNEGSGFSNPIFAQFHEAIALNNTVSNNLVQIAVLSLNNEALGYLVNFLYNNKVYFYLSALQESPDNKIKIGMTLHSEAIQYYAEQGIESYDFLGGEARYKKSLSNNEYQLSMECYYRNTLILRIESILKKLKGHF